ncbi:MAG: hypothetical protein HUU35_11125 [Armatimonadetes bacterium]|nr:hypothetical protein [Armatimonadota bacterium]
MTSIQWYPGNYSGYGVVDSRIYVTPFGQALAVLAQDVDAQRADPIVMACGLKPAGNGGHCWCVAPLLTSEQTDPPFPNACFSTVDEVESYLREWTTDETLPAIPPAPIGEDEFFQFVRFTEESFTLPEV